MVCKISYHMETPDNVKGIAKAFKKKMKRKLMQIKFTKPSRDKPSDVDLVFISIVSRSGTDIDAAVSKITDSKPALLVVLHHTFNTEAVTSKSSTCVQKPNIHTVDCLFYEDKGLLSCKANDEAYKDAARWLSRVKELMSMGKKPQELAQSFETHNFNNANVTIFRLH
ncbi:hypothetical protein DNTS_024964 [Danionella cerebrum]|uniref:Uncharacterized protein n=1 Tax=Danionella cerebrum TaxID=2873325 RepID=A0A553MW16_9TELE|nr:hypothetical protein DNTS_024964 [Danionella translucida]